MPFLGIDKSGGNQFSNKEDTRSIWGGEYEEGRQYEERPAGQEAGGYLREACVQEQIKQKVQQTQLPWTSYFKGK